jgi:hypothetical protein
MKTRLILFAVILTAVSCGCATLEERQTKLVSAYLKAHPDIRSDVKTALFCGKVIPGMSREEVYLASGIKAQQFRNYSIWVVGKNGELLLPSTTIAPGSPVAIKTKNGTQFESGSEQEFVVYFDDSNNQVTEVKESIVENAF